MHWYKLYLFAFEKNEKIDELAKEPISGAIDLSDDNFHSHVASGEHFVKFYAPW